MMKVEDKLLLHDKQGQEQGERTRRVAVILQELVRRWQ
jgi:hypothetical protein